MDYSEKIRSAWIRSTKGLAKRPDIGKITHCVTARMTEGLTCEIEAEDYRFTADWPENAGGNDRGASPTFFLETALASCLAIGFRQCLAARELPVETIEVEVTTTFDVRGQYGLDDSKMSYDGPVRYTVRVESPAAEEAVLDALNWVDAHSPLTNILRNPNELQRTVNITRVDG